MAGLVRQPDAGQRHASEADSEFLQRCAARDRLGEAFGEFIELVLHTFPFVCGRPIARLESFMFWFSMGCYPLQQENWEDLTGNFCGQC